MKYIHFVLIGLCIVLSAFVTPVYGTEVNAMIHYSEKFVEFQSEFELEQGYSIKVIDINPKNGDSWIELYLNGNKIDTDVYFARENTPFEYIKTVTNENEEDDDEEQEEDYLIIRLTPIEVLEEPLSVKLKIEQFLDPKFDSSEYRILDRSRSFKVGTPLELEEDYTLKASDMTDTSITLSLNKNGYLIKENKEVEIGDIFTYSKTVNGKVVTIFIAKLDNFFVGTDSEVVFLEQVSQRVDIVVESGVTITVEGADSTKLRDGDIAIIRYTFENADISEVEIMLDGNQIDSRKVPGTGTHSTVTGKLDAGIHEIMINAVTEDGIRSTHTKVFTVEPSIASDAAGLAAEAASNLIDKVNVSEDDENVGIPGFGSMLSAVMIGLVFMSVRRGTLKNQ